MRSCSCLPENDSDYMGSSKSLDEAMNETPEAFTKIIIETFPTREIANSSEQWLHETYDVARNPLFYNRCIAPMGFCRAERTHSDSTKKKMSESAKGKPRSAETRKKISEAKMGKTFSEETLKKMSDSQRGRKHSPETRKKMSAAQSGEKGHWYGKHLSPETRKKMSGPRGPQKKIQCPHCSKIGGNAMMKRHHFNNCREIS